MAELFQVEFSGSRREYYYNTYYHTLKLQEYVIIQAEQGEDIGQITRKVDSESVPSSEGKPRSILRPAGTDDLDRYAVIKKNEQQYIREVIQMVRQHGLQMKIVDVDCLFDGSKITFYFTADHRVDFRALVRELASKYKTRIELRQIGVRDEARRVDGYGVCGRRQCCNGHITEFEPITTQHARDQDMSLNPSKISGTCGRLLCCLKYEVDMYTSIKKQFPPVGSRIKTSNGMGFIERIDIFKEVALFRNEEEIMCEAKADGIIKISGSAQREINSDEKNRKHSVNYSNNLDNNDNDHSKNSNSKSDDREVN